MSETNKNAKYKGIKSIIFMYIILTDQPLREVLQKMTISSRMVKWSIELSEFSLEYQPRKAIKAQALVDFVAECSFYDWSEEGHLEDLGNKRSPI